MTNDNTDEILRRFREKHLDHKGSGPAPVHKPRSKIVNGIGKVADYAKSAVFGTLGKAKDGIGSFISKHKKFVAYTSLGLLAGGAFGTYLAWDALSKRQTIPERNILFKVQQQVYYAGGEREQSASGVDKSSITTIYRGGREGGELKVEDIVATALLDESDEWKKYELKNKHDLRIANSSTKNEFVQSGININGAYNFQERFAYIDDEDTMKKDSITFNEVPNALLSYRVEPERGNEDIRINAIKENGKIKLVNKLTEGRSVVLGWLWGINYRSGTTLENYVNPEGPQTEELLDLIREYNQQRLHTDEDDRRMELIDQILELDKKMPKKIVFKDYEDGIIDWLPQESTIYLAEDPSYLDRQWFEFTDWLQQAKERVTLGILDKGVGRDWTLRVENHWDLWPGNIPLLNKFRYSDYNSVPPKVFSLFDKTNNGGYKIIDNVGTVALIEIKDFLLHYDRDVVYMYYADRDGNGEIDKNKELIGQVLYRITFGQSGNLESIDRGEEKRDITYYYNYTFMGGYETSPIERYNDFKLSAYVESAMSDALNRGYGKHSDIGYINDVRSSIMLYNERTTENLSRIFSQENSYVVASDIYRLLKEAKRPYADEYAKKVGLFEIQNDQTTKQDITDVVDSMNVSVPTDTVDTKTDTRGVENDE